MSNGNKSRNPGAGYAGANYPLDDENGDLPTQSRRLDPLKSLAQTNTTMAHAFIAALKKRDGGGS